jgi:putative phage-type endonuclease
MYTSNNTYSVNGLIDRCINRRLTDKESIGIMNTVFQGRDLFTKKDIVERKLVHESNREKVDALRAIPLVEQKSPEWHEIRRNLITASDFAQALGEGKFGTQKQLYRKKCGFEEDNFNANLAPLVWGNMFEQVAQAIYAQRNDVHVYEFGIIKHPTLTYFGASPDGITENGIMIEIKCPFKRKINGEIPVQYYYQIQGQLDVCDLQECDYFECEFTDMGDNVPNPKDCLFEYGAIIQRVDNEPTYLYSDSKRMWKKNELETWVKNNSNSEGTDTLHYYKLDTCNCMRVERNKDFLHEKLDLLRGVWEKVSEYRCDESLYKKEVSKTSKYSRSMKLDDYVL